MDRQELHRQIDHVFIDLLPARGREKRDSQIQLCHRLLDAMLDGKIILCDAGTGIGKTDAYLLAATMFQLSRFDSRMEFQPVIVSTSSIALQTAVHKEYLPFLSDVLTQAGLLSRSLQSVTRKGKSHYACDQKLEWRLDETEHRSEKKIRGLLALQQGIDLDEIGMLKKYDLQSVRVPDFCTCNRRYCRYHAFLDDCEATPYAFQICNHNLFLADAIRRKLGHRPILPDRCTVIIDEAHKLPEAARDMLSVSIDARAIRDVIYRLRKGRYLLASEWLEEAAAPLFQRLLEPRGRISAERSARFLVGVNWVLTRIQKQLQGVLPPADRRQLDTVSADVSFLVDDRGPEKIFYTSKNQDGETTLCATVPDASSQLQNLLWNPAESILLVSGTLAVGKDFTSFQQEAGLKSNRRVEQAIFPSPFDYRKHCLLYLPLTPPQKKKSHYYKALAEEIAALIKAACGHALVLFTSYHALSKTTELLTEQDLHRPLFATSQNADYAVRQFREHPGSILLATGAVWEGVDFPGDCVSLLIIPRLPFPIPDAISEAERKRFADISSYIHSGPVPRMQIKLRQGFGRAIRTERDTCVVAILDERATPGNPYHADVMDALPKMRKTRNLHDVETFIHTVKSAPYFTEGLDGQRQRRTALHDCDTTHGSGGAGGLPDESGT